ncbi:MAG: PilZ domain-containing protein [Candidatus Omnitrophica bacterium]|nr:PilZ domain-containing protein [Candidatus Omnitrophota bacterium]
MSFDKINRRRFLRIKFPFTLHLYPGGELPISAYTEDISAGGVKVTIHQELKVPSLINLEIYVKLRPIVCKGKVVWVKRRESEFLDGEIFFDIGIEFQDLSLEGKEAVKERLDKIMQVKNAEREVEA